MKTINPPLNSRRGFTIIELLIVLGVIAILISILIPAVQTANRHTKTIKCMSNLGQLAAAVNCYCLDNNGMYPTPGVGWVYTDWVYWQPGQNIKASRIAPYVAVSLPTILVCPADEVLMHTDKVSGYYQYSYTINEFMARTYALSHPIPIRFTKVERPAEKILLVDESGGTIDDSCWAPQNYALDGHNLLSNRHDRRTEASSDANAGKGNVGYADGHAAFIPRLDATLANNYTAYTNEPPR